MNEKGDVCARVTLGTRPCWLTRMCQNCWVSLYCYIKTYSASLLMLYTYNCFCSVDISQLKLKVVVLVERTESTAAHLFAVQHMVSLQLGLALVMVISVQQAASFIIQLVSCQNHPILDSFHCSLALTLTFL